MRLTREPVLVSVPLHYAGFLCEVDVCCAWKLRQFLQELHSNAVNPHHTYIHITKSSQFKYILHLKLLLKAWALCLWVLFVHACDDCPKFMGNHSSVSTTQVVIEGIMDEGILVLWKDCEITDDRTAYIHDSEKSFRRISNVTGT